MVMKATEVIKLECAPVEIIKIDTDRFEIKAESKKVRLHLGEIKSYARTYGKNIPEYRYSYQRRKLDCRSAEQFVLNYNCSLLEASSV